MFPFELQGDFCEIGIGYQMTRQQ